MKTSILALLLLFTVSAFASLDDLVGKYKSMKDGSTTGYAEISKVVVSPANLFEPAKYEYRLDLEGSQDGLYLLNGKLEITADKNNLLGEYSLDCDDPGCNYLDDVTVKIGKSSNGNPYIKVDYYGVHLEDGDEDEYILEGTEILRKSK